MNVKDKIAIYLITYNRKKYLERTLSQILAQDSPIKNFDITIIDNASTDGTSELITTYCDNYKNMKHIRHKINIGGNANICRAFELSAASGKEYAWVLCDDDMYDFSNWKEVESEIENKTDIICVSNYAFKSKNDYNKKESQLFQLTFVPAGIYKTELITDNVLINMYDAIYTMFSQSCITIDVINKNKKIHVLDHYIVQNGLNCENACENNAYTRGSELRTLKRRKDTTWLLGYSNILSLLENSNNIPQYMKQAILQPEICGNYKDFVLSILRQCIKTNDLNYLFEYLKVIDKKLKQLIFLKIFILLLPLRFYKTQKGIYLSVLYKLKLKLIPFRNK